MISTFGAVFAACYIIYAYILAYRSSWFYSLLTSVLWGPGMYGALQLYSPLVHASSITSAVSGFVFQFILISSGGIIIALFYVAPVWGGNRALWTVWLLMMYPTPFVLFIGICGIIVFHPMDIIYNSLKGQDSWRQRFTHVGYTSQDYSLD